VPRSGGSGGDIGGGAGEHDGNGRGGAMAAAEEADDGPEIAPRNLETWIYESIGIKNKHLASKKGFR
jgi:hypothetical protein